MCLNLNRINTTYHSAQGDTLAKEELLPVVTRLTHGRPVRILEVGCGFGRNLVALSGIPDSRIVGCDTEVGEINKAKTRLSAQGIHTIELVAQTDPGLLPFENNSFDIVVCWQVLEHVLSQEGKKNIIEEMVRVVKHEGFILCETPNALFPIDYHDTNLPFVHWILPLSWRRKLIAFIRKSDWPASRYTTEYYIKKILKHAPGVQKIIKSTKVYFEQRYRDIFVHMSGTRILFKKIYFMVYAPFYGLFRLLGVSGDMLMPSVRVVFQIFKK